jgi:phosphoethanolamine N-methyltransferase
MNKWTWMCPWLAIALAAAVLVIWGLTLWTALAVALLLVCPAIMLWGVIKLPRPPNESGEDK